jgi:serine/threonine protein phosphatase PrpC
MVIKTGLVSLFLPLMVSGKCDNVFLLPLRLLFLLTSSSFSKRDVMTNQEAVEMVVETNKESAFQLAAEWLTQEAYIRGSSDNIGVCVVEIV